MPSGEGTEAGLAAAGRTDSEGTFYLNAIDSGQSGAGTKVGEYIVSVMKQRGDPVPTRAADALPGSPPLNLKIQDLLPVTYKSAATSPLRATVKQGRNTFRFDLDSSARGGEKR